MSSPHTKILSEIGAKNANGKKHGPWRTTYEDGTVVTNIFINGIRRGQPTVSKPVVEQPKSQVQRSDAEMKAMGNCSDDDIDQFTKELISELDAGDLLVLKPERGPPICLSRDNLIKFWESSQGFAYGDCRGGEYELANMPGDYCKKYFRLPSTGQWLFEGVKDQITQNENVNVFTMKNSGVTRILGRLQHIQSEINEPKEKIYYFCPEGQECDKTDQDGHNPIGWIDQMWGGQLPRRLWIHDAAFGNDDEYIRYIVENDYPEDDNRIDKALRKRIELSRKIKNGEITQEQLIREIKLFLRADEEEQENHIQMFLMVSDPKYGNDNVATLIMQYISNMNYSYDTYMKILDVYLRAPIKYLKLYVMNVEEPKTLPLINILYYIDNPVDGPQKMEYLLNSGFVIYKEMFINAVYNQVIPTDKKNITDEIIKYGQTHDLGDHDSSMYSNQLLYMNQLQFDCTKRFDTEEHRSYCNKKINIGTYIVYMLAKYKYDDVVISGFPTKLIPMFRLSIHHKYGEDTEIIGIISIDYSISLIYIAVNQDDDENFVMNAVDFKDFKNIDAFISKCEHNIESSEIVGLSLWLNTVTNYSESIVRRNRNVNGIEIPFAEPFYLRSGDNKYFNIEGTFGIIDESSPREPGQISSDDDTEPRSSPEEKLPEEKIQENRPVVRRQEAMGSLNIGQRMSGDIQRNAGVEFTPEASAMLSNSLDQFMVNNGRGSVRRGNYPRGIPRSRRGGRGSGIFNSPRGIPRSRRGRGGSGSGIPQRRLNFGSQQSTPESPQRQLNFESDDEN